MSSPPSSPSPDREPRLEQEVVRLARALKAAERNVGMLQWLFSLLIVGGVAAIILVRNKVVDINQILNVSSVHQSLESKEFGLYNREGKRVMIGDYDKFGYPSLAFLDLDLNYKMGIKIYSDAPGGAPGIAYYDKTGTRALFRMGEEGDALIQLLGQDKKGGVVLKVTPDGSPSLTMKDASGKVLFHIPEGAPIPSLSPSQSARSGPTR